MKVNKKGILNLSRKTKTTFQNFGKKAIKIVAGSALVMSLTVGMTEPAFAQKYPDYAYVPYNQNWGNKEAIRKVFIQVTNTGIGVVKKEETSRELLEAIYDCIEESKVINSRHSLISFSIFYNQDLEPMIDSTSFQLYKGKLSALGNLSSLEAYLPVKVFMAPDGQQWVNEKNYIAYAKDKNIVYQCSDGSLSHSYQEFRDWECELAYRPSKPNYPVYPECKKKLTEIGYLEALPDGSIWKDQTMLEEYLKWRENKNYGVKDGVFFGSYGIASSFEDYVRLYNISYYVTTGLRREEQFYGAHGFLYASREQAHLSIDKLNGYQKVKEK